MRRALAIWTLLAVFLLCFAGSASAYVDYGSKNRVGSFGDPFAPQVGFADPLALELHQENTIAVYDPATGVLFYVKQNPWTYFDPLGLRAKNGKLPEGKRRAHAAANARWKARGGWTSVGQGAAAGAVKVVGYAGAYAGAAVQGKLAGPDPIIYQNISDGVDAGAEWMGVDTSKANYSPSSNTVEVGSVLLTKKLPGGKKTNPTKSQRQTKAETEVQVEQASPQMVSPSELVSRQGPSEMTGNKVKRLRRNMREEGFDPEHPVEFAEVEGRKILIDGHHRTEAARQARVQKIPAVEKKVSADEASQLADDAAEAAQERASRER